MVLQGGNQLLKDENVMSTSKKGIAPSMVKMDKHLKKAISSSEGGAQTNVSRKEISSLDDKDEISASRKRISPLEGEGKNQKGQWGRSIKTWDYLIKC